GRLVHGVPAGDFVYRNSFDLFAHALELCREHRLGPSLAVFEPGFLRAVLAWWHAGRLPAGGFLKLYFATDEGLTIAIEPGLSGSPFGLRPTALALAAYLELLEGCTLPWAVSIAGGDVVASDVARLALEH